MTTTTTFPQAAGAARIPAFSRLLRDRVTAQLGGLRSGALRFFGPGVGADIVCGEPDGPLGTAAIEVQSPAFWSLVALRGSLGAGEGFMQGHWRCADPARVVRIMLRDRHVLDAADSGLARLCEPLLKAWHWLRANTVSGSRRNIAAHYDLGNDFFALFLDPSMTYSSAVFAPGEHDLERAQQAKLARLCQKLGLREGMSMLEIGTGWGSMSMCAAQRFGAEVTTTTISERQFELAQDRVAAAGLQGRVRLLQSDYRKLTGSFDRLVHCEMVEAVGHQFLPGFFGQCSRLLREGGAMAMQAITIQDQNYRAALKSVDFIKRYVFPGSFIPSVTALVDAATKGSDFRLVHLEDFARHYAETLRQWRLRLHQNRGAILSAGYSEELLRLWEWYLAYCEGGFAERYLGVAHLVFARPGSDLSVDSAALAAVDADPYRG